MRLFVWCAACPVTQFHRFWKHLSLWTYVKVVQSVFSSIVLGQTRTSLSPGRIKTCLYTEFFIFREVPPNLKNEAKNMTISVERHGEMRQGSTSESKFDFKRRRRKKGFFLSCRVNYEISFSLEPTTVTRTWG